MLKKTKGTQHLGYLGDHYLAVKKLLVTSIDSLIPSVCLFHFLYLSHRNFQRSCFPALV